MGWLCRMTIAYSPSVMARLFEGGLIAQDGTEGRGVKYTTHH